MLAPPVLSLLDLDAVGEGSTDPLSLSTIYERLADRVLPAVTVRMGRIRFVTAMCAAARVCRDFDEDIVAKDGVTPPWLVCEWFVIEALVRTRDTLDDAARIPGALKVAHCIRNKRPVTDATYLKTPKVFGFSGIFRRLATTLGFLTDDLALDDVGYELLRAWERDQGLDGFLDGPDGGAGDGILLRNSMRKAVKAGLDVGSTVIRPREFWSDIAERLQPGRPGGREKVVLRRALRGSHLVAAAHEAGFADEVISALIDRGTTIDRTAEPKFLRRVARNASDALAKHLAAIDAYERLCVPVAAAFDLVRHMSTTAAFGPVTADQFARHALAPRLITLLADGRKAVEDDPKLLEWEPDVRTLLESFGEVRRPGDLFDAVVDHHYRTQQAKPPDGKRPWVERLGSSVILRTAYPVPERPSIADSYVHDYRTSTLSRFLRDLGQVS